MSEYELVMPFVVCASNGGPYEDEAFVAGWRLAELNILLSRHGSGAYLPVRHADVPQADLIAMRYGYSMTLTPYDDEWSTAEFTKVAARA